MKKIYKFVLGVMKAFIALLVIACIGILLYAQFAPEEWKVQQVQEKENKVLQTVVSQGTDELTIKSEKPQDNIKQEETCELVTEEIIEDIQEDVQEEKEEEVEIVSEVEPITEPTSGVLDDMQKQIEMDENVREVYLFALKYLKLEAHNLSYDGIIDAYNQTCPAFSVIDNEGNKQLPQLVFYNPSQSLYYYNPSTEPVRVQSGDYAWINAGKEAEVLAYNHISTDNPGGNTWEEALQGYLNALLYERDLQKVASYVDTSCYLETDMEYSQAYDSMKMFQRYIVRWLTNGNDREHRKASGEIMGYNLNYQIGENTWNTDEAGNTYRVVKVYYTLEIIDDFGVETETEADTIILQMYPDGWKVVMHKA